MANEIAIEVTDSFDVKNTSLPVTVGIADSITIGESKRINVGANDSLAVVPFQSASSVAFKIPQSVVEGIASIESIRDNLLTQVAHLELAFIEATQYIDTIKDNVREQILTEISGKYLANDDAEAFISSIDLSNMRLTTEYDAYGNPVATASFQDIVDRHTEVGNSVSGFSSSVDAATTNASTAIQKTEELSAKIDGVEVRLATEEGVTVGLFKVWDGIEPLKIGMIKFIGDVQYQYLGGALGEDSDGWVRTDTSAQATADGKIKSFYIGSTAEIPTSEGIGDLWIDTDDNNKLYRAASKGANEIKSGEWEQVTDDSALDTFITTIYSTDLLNIGNQLDGVAVTYFQANIPYAVDSSNATADRSGDVWYIHDDGNSLPTSKYTTKTVVTTDGVAAAATYVTTATFAFDEAYKFIYTKTSGANATSFTEVWKWEKITDATILNTLKKASGTKAAADRSIKNYTSQPTTPYYIGDTWMQGTSGDIYVCGTERLTGSFTQSDWVIASKYTDDTAANRVVAVTNGTGVPTAIANPKDIYVRTDAWYTAATGTSISTAPPSKQYGNVVYERSAAGAWVLLSNGQQLAVKWAGGASKLLYGPNGAVTGWSFADGSEVKSEFQIRADVFKIVDSTVQTGDTPASPFSTVRNTDGTHTVNFNGKVIFGNSTIDTRAGGTTVISGSDINAGSINLNGLSNASIPTGFTGSIIDVNGLRVYQNGAVRVKLGLLV